MENSSIPAASDDGGADTVKAMLSCIGVHPDERVDRQGAAELLGRLGFRCGRAHLGKLACWGNGPAYVVAFGRSVYRAGDLAAWAVSRARKPSDSPQAETARKRRERGERLGRPPRNRASAMNGESTAAAA